MRVIRKLGLASAIAGMSIALTAGGAIADSRMFHAYLYGGNEVPNDGDPDAYGMAMVVATLPNQLCYAIILKDAAAATAAHIHAGAAGVAGGIVVTLNVLNNVPTRSQGCATLPPATVTTIRDNPQDFYVNVHNAEFPGGAARGQLQ
jgi:hypothetical protein